MKSKNQFNENLKAIRCFRNTSNTSIRHTHLKPVLQSKRKLIWIQEWLQFYLQRVWLASLFSVSQLQFKKQCKWLKWRICFETRSLHNHNHANDRIFKFSFKPTWPFSRIEDIASKIYIKRHSERLNNAINYWSSAKISSTRSFYKALQRDKDREDFFTKFIVSSISRRFLFITLIKACN